MLRRALSSFGRFLVSVTTEPVPEAPKLGISRSKSRAEFGKRATRLARDHGPENPLLAGSIQVLGLSEIAQEMGLGWKTKSAALLGLAEDAIDRHLQQGDTYVRGDGDSFILCFTASDSKSAKERLQAITDDIRHALGEFASDDRVQVVHEVVEIDIVDVEDESVIDMIAGSLKKMREEAENTARLWRQHLIRTASVTYKPIWSSRKKLVAIHRAVLDDETGRRAMQRLATLSSADEMRAILFEIDSLILARAAEALHGLVGDGGRTQLIIPLYYDSVESRSRRRKYQEICENIPVAYRRFLLFEVHDIPTGIPYSRISELAMVLNKYGNGILLEVELENASMPVAMGIAGVVTRVPERASTSEFAGMAERFAANARTARLKSFLYDIDSGSVAGSAWQAGVDYLQGSTIAKPTKELRAHYHWDLKLAS